MFPKGQPDPLHYNSTTLLTHPIETEEKLFRCLTLIFCLAFTFLSLSLSLQAPFSQMNNPVLLGFPSDVKFSRLLINPAAYCCIKQMDDCSQSTN